MIFEMSDSPDFPLPPANFLFLVESLLMQVQVQLGLLNFGETDEKPEVDLPLARHSIDLLGMLQEKTKGNLTPEELRLLENGLTELRFRYVQVADEQKVKNEPTSRLDTAKSESPLIITPDGGKGSKTE